MAGIVCARPRAVRDMRSCAGRSRRRCSGLAVVDGVRAVAVEALVRPVGATSVAIPAAVADRDCSHRAQARFHTVSTGVLQTSS